MVIKSNIYLKKTFFELDWIKNNSDFRLMVIKVVDWSHVLGTYLSLTDSKGQKPGKGEKRRFFFFNREGEHGDGGEPRKMRSMELHTIMVWM